MEQVSGLRIERGILRKRRWRSFERTSCVRNCREEQEKMYLILIYSYFFSYYQLCLTHLLETEPWQRGLVQMHLGALCIFLSSWCPVNTILLGIGEWLCRYRTLGFIFIYLYVFIKNSFVTLLFPLFLTQILNCNCVIL